nr:hypothetical protein [Cyclobacteriaceae bacterium]
NDNRLIFDEERIRYTGTRGYTHDVDRSIGHGHSESKLKAQIDEDPLIFGVVDNVFELVGKEPRVERVDNRARTHDRVANVQ